MLVVRVFSFFLFNINVSSIVYSQRALKPSEYHPKQTKESNLDRHQSDSYGGCLFTAFQRKETCVKCMMYNQNGDATESVGSVSMKDIHPTLISKKPERLYKHQSFFFSTLISPAVVFVCVGFVAKSKQTNFTQNITRYGNEWNCYSDSCAI